MKSCPDKRCYVPDVQCRLGEASPADCPVWSQAAERQESEAGGASPQSSLPPWSGSALGTRDLAFLTGRREPKLVAIVGGQNAGKTTLLASWYQQLGRTGDVGEGRFAGSMTLEGWEAVGHALRWHAGIPHFPPHTSSGTGRAPGLLHLAVRQPRGELDDFLFADSPGEWFQRWAVDRDAKDAEGARWLVERASAIIVVADSDALSGEGRGLARNAMVQLVRRVAAERKRKPVALVWAKADIPIPVDLREAVRNAALQAIPDITEYSASIIGSERSGAALDAGQSLKSVFHWALRPLARGFEIPRRDSAAGDAFFDFGRSA